MSSAREADLRQLVLDRYADLPAQQKLVADWILAHLQDVPFASIPEIAAKSGASEATVVRFAQRIGFPGFAGMKTRLLQGVRERVGRKPRLGQDEVFARVPQDDTLLVIARQEVANVEQSVADLDREAFGKAATALYRADHVYCFGLGISSCLSEIAAYLLTQIGVRATPLSSRYSSPLEQLVALRAADLLLVFSFPPYSKSTLAMAREARDRGLPTVAVTDRATAPIARLARHVLPVRSENLMFTNSLAAATVLLNALATEIARRHSDRAGAAVTRITRILAEDDDVLRGDR